jgi:flagellar FliL protein
MADAPADAPPPAKPRSDLLKTVVLVLGFVLAAGAAGLGATVGVLRFGGGMLGATAPGAAPAEAPLKPALPVEYVEIDTPFTSNLVDTGRYLQLRLSVSTLAGKPVVEAIALHKPALVSAVLAVLGDLGEADVASRETKDQLRQKLKEVINQVLRDRGVPGTIDEVFIVSLVIQ